ncbi:MAG: hypothetical protein Kilf2KO_15550 [Rhodospirillales bacterium]
MTEAKDEKSGEAGRKDPTELTGPARSHWLKERRRRNWAIFLALISFIVAVYFVAMVRMGGL